MFKCEQLVKHLSAGAFLASIALGSASFASQASADQFDPLLDGYFAALAEAESMVEIKIIEQQIWDLAPERGQRRRRRVPRRHGGDADRSL